MSTAEATLRRFPWFAALSMTPIMVPVIVLFWQQNGLDTSDIYLLQSAFALAVVLLEVPTGMVADRLGKRTSLVAGQVAIAAGSVVYALGTGFWSFLAAEVVLALGASLVSGADAALVYDSLKRLGRPREYAAYESRIHAMRLGSFAVAQAVGGFIGAWSVRGAMWASAVGPAVAIVVAIGLREALPPTLEGERDAWRAYTGLLRDATKFVLRHRLVRWLAAFAAVLTGSATWLLWAYQPYMALVGWPIWSFGLIFASYNLFAALSSRLADRMATRAGPTGVLVLLGALQALPPLLMGLVVSPASVFFVLGHQAVRGLGRPILNGRILAYTRADKRATVLSLVSMAGRLFFALTGPLVGVIGERGLVPAFLAQGAALVVLGAGFAVAYVRIPEKYFVVKAGID